jgi:hypothetical protein
LDSSEIISIITFWQFHIGSLFDLLSHGLDVILIKLDLTWLKNWCLNESEIGITKY